MNAISYGIIGILMLTNMISLYSQEITFSDHIAPIVLKKCTPCHHKGNIGPMPLTNYDEVAAYASMIAYVTKEKYMPPWPADPNYRHFLDEKNFTHNLINR